jgi:hypothetical protein
MNPMKSLLWARQLAQRRQADAAELKRRINHFGRLMPQLEALAFDEHLAGHRDVDAF